MNQKGTKPSGRDVVQVVRIIRSVGAAVAACAVLSGCVGGDVDEGAPDVQSTSQVIAETQANPWDLPIEQRPDLFDPCAEIPMAALEQGFGGPVEPVQQFTRHQPDELMACSWTAENVEINILSTWKSRDQYLKDESFNVADPAFELGGRTGARLLDAIDTTERACLQVFFTERGSTWLMLDLIGRFREFDGERFADACVALEKVGPPIIQHFPEGDFK